MCTALNIFTLISKIFQNFLIIIILHLEFNVNFNALPFWALSVYFFWKGVVINKKHDWKHLHFFSDFGLFANSKYLFIYILVAYGLWIFNFQFKKNIKNQLKIIFYQL